MRWQAQRSAWVQDNFTTYWLKCLWKTSQLLSTRDLGAQRTRQGPGHSRGVVGVVDLYELAETQSQDQLEILAVAFQLWW